MLEKLNSIEERASVIDNILHDLPEWFGIEASISEYIEEGKNLEMLSYYVEQDVLGFLSYKENSTHTLEIYVIGVKRGCQGLGIGTKLILELERYAIEKGYKFIEVKTVDESFLPYNEAYAKTRHFYLKMGFYKLECIKDLWNQNCPCLIMVKSVERGL